MCVKKNKICSEMCIQRSTRASRLGFLLSYSLLILGYLCDIGLSYVLVF
jgi:hypothetical protein